MFIIIVTIGSVKCTQYHVKNVSCRYLGIGIPATYVFFIILIITIIIYSSLTILSIFVVFFLGKQNWTGTQGKHYNCTRHLQHFGQYITRVGVINVKLLHLDMFS